MADNWTPTPSDTLYKRVGGGQVVRAIVARFFSSIEEQAPALAALHRCNPPGHVTDDSRERFTLFFIGWMDGPREDSPKHPLPSSGLRIPVSQALRDIWLRCMNKALDGTAIEQGVRSYLDRRFLEVADALGDQ